MSHMDRLLAARSRIGKTFRRTCRMGLPALVIAVVTVVGIGATGAPASAWLAHGHGCRFDPRSDDDGLGIGFGGNQDAGMASMTQDAAARWNARMSPQFTLVAYGSSTRDVRVDFTWSLPGNVGAQTTTWCGSDHYTQDPAVLWNRAETYYAGTNQRWSAIATHELGHAYGLDHNATSGCNGSVAGLMYSDAVAKTNLCGWWGPTADDAAGAQHHHFFG